MLIMHNGIEDEKSMYIYGNIINSPGKGALTAWNKI